MFFGVQSFDHKMYPASLLIEGFLLFAGEHSVTAFSLSRAVLPLQGLPKRDDRDLAEILVANGLPAQVEVQTYEDSFFGWLVGAQADFLILEIGNQRLWFHHRAIHWVTVKFVDNRKQVF